MSRRQARQRRGQLEDAIASAGWLWDEGLSLPLDGLVIAEEAAA